MLCAKPDIASTMYWFTRFLSISLRNLLSILIRSIGRSLRRSSELKSSTSRAIWLPSDFIKSTWLLRCSLLISRQRLVSSSVRFLTGNLVRRSSSIREVLNSLRSSCMNVRFILSMKSGNTATIPRVSLNACSRIQLPSSKNTLSFSKRGINVSGITSPYFSLFHLIRTSAPIIWLSLEDTIGWYTR